MTSFRVLFPMAMIWLFPVMYFVVDPNYNPSAFPTWLAFIASLILCLFNKRYLIWMIPFIALISPLATANNPLVFLPSEIYVAFLAFIGTFVLITKNKIKLNLLKGDRYLILLFVIFIFATLLSFEFHNLIKSVINVFIIVLIFCFTRGILKDEKDVSTLLDSFLLASLLACLLIFSSLLSGVSLSSLMGPADSFVVFATEAVWWRASYFYANVGYVIGIAALIAFCRLLLTRGPTNKTLIFLAFIFLFSALLAMVEKTGLVALSITIIFILSLVSIKKGAANLILLSFVFALAITPVLYLFLIFSQDIDLVTRFQIGGLSQRLCVLGNTLGVFIENPHRAFFGFGPDSILFLSNEFTQAATSNCSGRKEGAIDSGYFSYLFDYGIFFLVSFLLFLIHSLFRFVLSFKASESNYLDQIYLIFISMIVYVSFCALTDVISTSKTAWLLFQLFSIFGIALNFGRPKKEFS